MRKLIVAVALVIAVLLSPSVKAAEDEVPKTVQDFISACKEDSQWVGFCMGMIKGIQFGLFANSREKTTGKFRICTPKVVSLGQYRQVFLNWANAHPKEWQYEATAGILIALVEAYPCK